MHIIIALYRSSLPSSQSSRASTSIIIVVAFIRTIPSPSSPLPSSAASPSPRFTLQAARMGPPIRTVFATVMVMTVAVMMLITATAMLMMMTATVMLKTTRARVMMMMTTVTKVFG